MAGCVVATFAARPVSDATATITPASAVTAIEKRLLRFMLYLLVNLSESLRLPNQSPAEIWLRRQIKDVLYLCPFHCEPQPNDERGLRFGMMTTWHSRFD